MEVKVIGAGLAGSEAALQLAKRGIKVKLYEMKPEKYSEAHSNKNLAEIVLTVWAQQIAQMHQDF